MRCKMCSEMIYNSQALRIQRLLYFTVVVRVAGTPLFSVFADLWLGCSGGKVAYYTTWSSVCIFKWRNWRTTVYEWRLCRKTFLWVHQLKPLFQYEPMRHLLEPKIKVWYIMMDVHRRKPSWFGGDLNAIRGVVPVWSAEISDRTVD
jgi:hypothetical protein